MLVCIAGCFAACKKDDAPEFDLVAQWRIDTALIRNFVKEKGLENVYKSEEYGIFYQVLEPGDGVGISGNASVTADYEGRLINGTVFESAQNVTFSMREVIPCWVFGLAQIQNGGTVRIISPSYYGYQNIANQKIPANSILDFTVSVKDVK